MPAFVVRLDGSIVVDNPDDAISLARRLAADERRRPTPRTAPLDRAELPPAERLARFIRACSRDQRALLRTLKAGSPTMDALGAAAGTTAYGVGSIFTGMLRVARRYGFTENDLIVRRLVDVDGLQETTFAPGPALEVADARLL